MENKEKIIIIDDDIDFIEATKLVLQTKSYDVYYALDPDEGIEKIKEVNPDLIILDVMWPHELSGFEVCRKLKKLYRIPVLMITAVEKEFGIPFQTSAGDDDWLPTDEFLCKPVNPDLLLEKVNKLLH